MQDVAAALTRLILSALFAIPFVADWVARLLGWHIFFLADGTIQFLWGTALALLGAWGFHAVTLRSLLRGQVAPEAAVSAAVLALYGYSAWVAFLVRPPGREGLHFATLAAVLFLLNLGRLWEAVRVGRLAGGEPVDPSGGGFRLLRRSGLAVRYGGLLTLPAGGAVAAWRLWAGAAPEDALLSAVAALLALRPEAMWWAVWAPIRAAMRRGAEAGLHFLSEVALVRAREVRALVVHPRLLLREAALPAPGGDEPGGAVRRVGVRAVAELKAMGVSVCMTAAGADPVAERAGREAGVDRVLLADGTAGLSEHLSALRAGGGAVALFTQGREEQRALEAADLIFAAAPIPAGSAAARTITLQSADLRAVPAAIRLSRAALGQARAGLALTALYNGAAAAAAALGGLPPEEAAAAALLAGAAALGGAVRIERHPVR